MEGLSANLDGSELAGWGIAAVSRDNFVSSIVWPCHVRCWPASVLRCSLNNTAELTGFAEAVRWTDSFIPRGERVRILYNSKHVARVAFGVAHAGGRNIALANRCIDLFFRSKGKFHVTIHRVFGNIGNGCADCAASQGLRGLVSQDNLPSFWSDRRLLIDPLLSAPHCLSHVPEVLHNLVIELQLE